MTPTRTAAVLLVAALLAVAGAEWRVRSGDVPEALRTGGATPAARDPGDAAAVGPLVDSARAEARAGRHWHAARLLREAARSAPLTPEERLDLARADAGWRNWDGVVATLAEAPWLGTVGSGEGWGLLGRAHEARSEWEAAARAYGRYLTTPHASANPLRAAAVARQARALARAGSGEQAAEALESGSAPPVLLSWAALEAAAAAADSGRVAVVRSLLERVSEASARSAGRELVPRALLASGDSAAAETAYADLAAALSGPVESARAWGVVGALRDARGDGAGARRAWLAALEAGGVTSAVEPAARGLLEAGGLDADQALQIARVLDRAGRDALALDAYDLHLRLRGGAAGVAEGVRLERARLLASASGREGDAVEEFRALSTSDRERVGAPALESWARLRQRQGRAGDVSTLRGWLLDRYPGSPEAADVLFFRGDAPHDRNELDTAMREYRRLMEMAPSGDRAGLASMRVAQIHLLRGETEAALDGWESYLRAFPSGRRWQEASYWAARAHLSLADSARALSLVERLRRDDPFSYYTVLAAEMMGEPFRLDLPPGDAPPFPEWLREGLARVDLLRAADLTAGEDVEVGRLIARARTERGAQLRLAGELIARDRTIDGINLGWNLRAEGEPWTLALARVVFPWRYREVFAREGAEDGVDPYLTAALARQESAFDPDIRSAANAVGLMQLLPSTAAQLARTVGPDPFREDLLEVPDVNVHLGTLHLRDLLREYDGDITRFLAAYNAGAHRVTVWRDFAEAGDPLTFTERIPYAETRDYVKQVRRNLALYRQLYPAGGEVSPP